MGHTTDPKTGKTAPDPATTYERAKPAEESPSKSLDQGPARPGVSKEQASRAANPASQKPRKPSGG
ncbi:MAG: hypothetical protein QM754_10975 [Tepidisphaeraceae bacterium]